MLKKLVIALAAIAVASGLTAVARKTVVHAIES